MFSQKTLFTASSNQASMIFPKSYTYKKSTHLKTRFSSFSVDPFLGNNPPHRDPVLDQLVNTINKPYMENRLPNHPQGRGKRGNPYHQGITLTIRKGENTFGAKPSVLTSYTSSMQWQVYSLRSSLSSRKGGVNNPFLHKLKKVSVDPKKGIAVLNVVISKNNTQLTLSSQGGQVLKHGWASAGSCGFKNSRKSTIFAAQAATKSLCSKAKKANIRRLIVKFRGAGRARGALMQTLEKSSMKIMGLKECTPMVYNGCRRVRTQRK